MTAQPSFFDLRPLFEEGFVFVRVERASRLSGGESTEVGGLRLVCYTCESHGRRQTKERTNERTNGKACRGPGPHRREHSIRMEEGGEDNERPPPHARSKPADRRGTNRQLSNASKMGLVMGEMGAVLGGSGLGPGGGAVEEVRGERDGEREPATQYRLSANWSPPAPDHVDIRKGRKAIERGGFLLAVFG